MKKTAEEILSPLRGVGRFENSVDYDDAINAMEEYASQSVPPTPVTDKPFTEQNVGEIFGFDNGYLDEGVDLLNEKAIEWAANKDKGERMFTETEIGHLQSEVYKLTGKGEVMMLFNKLLGVSAS